MSTLQQLIDQDYDVFAHVADRELTDEQIIEMADAFGEEHLRADEMGRLQEIDNMHAECHRNPYADEEARQISAINRYLEIRRGY